ncbi:hypothetical protein ACF0H5_010376 [Mactra antiquata]
MWTRIIVLIHFLLNLVQCEETIPTFNYEDFCGGTFRDNAAIIVFDGSKLRTDIYDNKCKIDIIPSGDDSRIFFYFEEFQFSSYRSEENMTITEGGYINKVIGGLADYMYGTNSTLISNEQNFTTLGPKMEITYKCNTQYGARPSGTFRLVYLRFTTDTKCESEDEHLCPNGNCVDKQYYCSSEIRACTNDDLDCDTLTVIEGIVDQIINIAKNIGWIIVIAVVFYILRILYYKYRHRICDIFKRKPIDNRSTAMERRNSEERPSLQLEEIQVNTDVQPETTDTVSEVSLSSSRRSSNTLYSLPGDDTTLPTQQNTALPSAPPPSYESVMAPSYDEVMSNQEKYKHSGP